MCCLSLVAINILFSVFVFQTLDCLDSVLAQVSLNLSLSGVHLAFFKISDTTLMIESACLMITARRELSVPYSAFASIVSKETRAQRQGWLA